MYSFPNLFITPDGRPMVFFLATPDYDLLKIYVEAGGGEVADSPYGPYTIIISNCAVTAYGIRDVFHPDFIYVSCSRNSLGSLKKYRLKNSAYVEEFDPQEVLMQNCSWETAKNKVTFLISINGVVPKIILSRMDGTQKISESSDGSDYDENENDSSSDVSKDEAVSSKQHSRKRWRTPFNPAEDAKIIQFVVKKKGFSQLSSNTLYVAMSKVVRNHTWQSLKNRLLKTILVNLNKYDLSPEILQLFKRHAGSRALPHQSARSLGKQFILYTQKEDCLIVDYVRKNASSSTKLAGNMFWKTLARKHICPGRSWQSLRERFLRYLKKEWKGKKYDDLLDPKHRKGILQSNKIGERSNEDSGEEAEAHDNDNTNKKKLKEISPSQNSRPELETQVISSDSSVEEDIKERRVMRNPSRKRKLYHAKDDFTSPQNSSALSSPVSVSKQIGPNPLDAAVNRYQHFKAYAQRKLKNNMKSNINIKTPTQLSPDHTPVEEKAQRISTSEPLPDDDSDSTSDGSKKSNEESHGNVNVDDQSDPDTMARRSSSEATSSDCDDKLVNATEDECTDSPLQASQQPTVKPVAPVCGSNHQQSINTSTPKSALQSTFVISSDKKKALKEVFIEIDKFSDQEEAMEDGSIQTKKFSQQSCDLFGSESPSLNNKKCSVSPPASLPLFEPWTGISPEVLVFQDVEDTDSQETQGNCDTSTETQEENSNSKALDSNHKSDNHLFSSEVKGGNSTATGSVKKHYQKVVNGEESELSSDESFAWSEDGLSWNGFTFRLARLNKCSQRSEPDSSIIEKMASSAVCEKGDSKSESSDSEPIVIDPVGTESLSVDIEGSVFIDPVSIVSSNNGTQGSVYGQRFMESSSLDPDTQNVAVCSEQCVSSSHKKSAEKHIDTPCVSPNVIGSTGSPGKIPSVTKQKGDSPSPCKSPRLLTSTQEQSIFKNSVAFRNLVSSNADKNPLHIDSDGSYGSNLRIPVDAFAKVVLPQNKRKRSCLSLSQTDEDDCLSPVSISSKHVHWNNETRAASAQREIDNVSKRDMATSPIPIDNVSKRDMATSPIPQQHKRCNCARNLTIRDAPTSTITFIEGRNESDNEERERGLRTPSPSRNSMSCPSPLTPTNRPRHSFSPKSPVPCDIQTRSPTNRPRHDFSPKSPVPCNIQTRSPTNRPRHDFSPKSPVPCNIQTRSFTRQDSRQTRSKAGSNSPYKMNSPLSPKKRF